MCHRTTYHPGEPSAFVQIIVLKDGQIVGSGDAVEVMTDPKTEYTRTLVEASRATSLVKG